ncbi:MAG: hypothetical protein PHU11_01025 [Dysgonamonadaceae bacterium]|nr:hypothetical protein [Sulfurovum sp.]MDD3494462.1 hypothetical protein [Dysgonamonadaceae bacterium]
MKKLFIFIVTVLASTFVLAGGGGKSSSFGKWNYDKFGSGSQEVTSATAPTGYNESDPCQQYIHVNTKFHVRVKNWFSYLQIGRSGYAEMRATLGTVTKSCNIPYNDIEFHLYYDHTVKKTYNSDYIKVTMKGVGALNECYKATGFAFTSNGFVLPSNYSDSMGDITKKAILNNEKGCYNVNDNDLYEIKF